MTILVEFAIMFLAMYGAVSLFFDIRDSRRYKKSLGDKK